MSGSNGHKPRQPIVYVACPYLHADPDIRLARVRAAAQATMLLALRGVVAYSPLSHSFGVLTQSGQDAIPESYWLDHGLAMLGCCAAMMVVCIPGWEQSNGVRNEIEYAVSHGIPVWYFSPGVVGAPMGI